MRPNLGLGGLVADVLGGTEGQDQEEDRVQEDQAEREARALAEALGGLYLLDDPGHRVDEEAEQAKHPQGGHARDEQLHVDVVERNQAGPARLAGLGVDLPLGDDRQDEEDEAEEYDAHAESGDQGADTSGFKPDAHDENDPIAICYTSGTTGRPKGCILGQRESYNLGMSVAPTQHSTPGDRCLLMMPFFHIGAKCIQLAQHHCGGTVYMQRGFDPEAILKSIAENKITITHMAPVMVQQLFESPNIMKYDVSSLHTLIYSAAPMPTATASPCNSPPP